MKRRPTPVFRRADDGSIAVEMALILPLLLLFLALPLFFARVFWYYSVAEKAAHDAARFLSSTAQVDMKTQAPGNAEAPVATLARALVDAELKEIMPILDAVSVDVQCDLRECGYAVPQTIRVCVRLRIRDNLFGAVTDEIYNLAGDGLNLTSDVTMRYVGN